MAKYLLYKAHCRFGIVQRDVVGDGIQVVKRRMSLLEGIARGERALEEGRTLSHAQAKQRMARWLK